jgi:hypothetical protein
MHMVVHHRVISFWTFSVRNGVQRSEQLRVGTRFGCGYP